MPTLFKLFLCAVLATFSMTLFAAGSASKDHSAPIAAQRSGVYVDLSAGYAAVDWKDFGIGSFNGFSITRGIFKGNGTGGFSFGFDVGYQINNIMALDIGWYYLPTVKGYSNIFISNPSLKLDSWMAYLALKLIVPLSKHFDLWGKLGFGYRSLDWRGEATALPGFGDRDVDYFSGVFGAGLQYWLDQNWSLSAQYLYMLSHTSGAQISRRAPSANIIVGSVAYIFSV